MEPWIQMIITIICSLIASSGFWAYITRYADRKDVKTELLIGLAHDRIVYLDFNPLSPCGERLMAMKDFMGGNMTKRCYR